MARIPWIAAACGWKTSSQTSVSARWSSISRAPDSPRGEPPPRSHHIASGERGAVETDAGDDIAEIVERPGAEEAATSYFTPRSSAATSST